MKRIVALLILALIVSACETPAKPAVEVITTANIAKHIAELSSDRYKGRMPMSDTEEITTGYIAGAMKEIGLEPACNGSYFQEVPLLAVSSTISDNLELATPKGTILLPKLTGYVSFTRKMEEEINLDQSQLVFAGFGITAPEYGRDDYAEIDWKGKTALVFVNDPGYGTTGNYFKGNTMTYYGRWTYKFEEAARQGAAACLIIHETGPAGYPWSVVSNNGETTKLYLKPDDGYQDRCSTEGWISENSARQLFEACGTSFDEAKKQALKQDFKPYELPVKVSAQIHNHFTTAQSKNVCGYIKGSKNPDEAIVYTAHWDHLGVGTAIDGDSIYNGATDNASAVAWMLEIARAFKNGPAPGRSILFLSVTGEESGLLGSGYYAAHPFFPMNKTVACINTDVLLFLGAFNDVTLTGFGQSQLDQWVEQEAKADGRYLAADPNPENGMFFRSDQFPFVQQGVPAIFAKGYTDAKALGKEKTADYIAHYWKQIYHTPKDEYLPERDNLTGVVDDARLLYRVGLNLAQSHEWPGWNEGSEFKTIREQSIKNK